MVMKKLFGLFLLVLAFLAPSAANAVTCFWVGSTATWDNTNTGGGGAGGIKWASATGGGTTCAGAGTGGSPGAADIATFDGASGGGTVTVAATINGSNTVNQIAAGAFTGTLDFSVNNPNITATGAFIFSGTGNPRKFLMGTGTFTFTNTAGTVFDLATITNMDVTSDFSTATYTLTATATANRNFSGGGRTYGPLIISTNSSRGLFNLVGANTFASISLAAGTTVSFPTAATTTITTAPTWVGTASLPIGLVSSSTANAPTISVPSGTVSLTFGALTQIIGTGGATFSATNSYDLGRNTGWSITPPSVGGGGGGKIIGG